MPTNDGGLGAHLVGDKFTMGSRNLQITKLIGEGGFSYVYLAKELAEGGVLGATLNIAKNRDADKSTQSNSNSTTNDASTRQQNQAMVLKVTSIHSRAQREIAEKEAKLLSRLIHPSIVKMFDTCYRQVAHNKSSKGGGSVERPQHLILMEHCEGGHALEVCTRLAESGKRFDRGTLIIAFGQICNAVSYLHAQFPPIVHRDLKPNNFLVKNGAYKLCDFGSAVFGHVDLRTPAARADAEEVIEKTTTQMFRAPEMVDLFVAKKLTQATDVWALGCCLYSLAFLKNCFEEGSNLAILSRKYTIPEDNPYGEGLVELLDRMLAVDSKARADMTEVILCLSAVYAGRPLPPSSKKNSRSSSKGSIEGSEEGAGDAGDEKTRGNNAVSSPTKKGDTRVGSYRTDAQGSQQPVYDPTKATEGKKLASNSVAARRKRAAATAGVPTSASNANKSGEASNEKNSDPLAFGSFGDNNGTADDVFGSDSGFGEMKGFDGKEADVAANDFFGSFGKAEQNDNPATNTFDAAFDTGAWGDNVAPPSSSEEVSAGDPPAGNVDRNDSLESAKGAERRDSQSDSVKKDRSRRRRGAGGTSRSSGRAGSIETGVQNLGVSETGATDEKKDRRSRPSRQEEGDDRRRRSGSHSRRKGRPRPMVSQDANSTDPEKKTSSKKGSNFNRMFGRGKDQPPVDPPDS